ncbi:hypothetical protein SOV_03960 [Sporomusa ovata DSM 2662]|uniref:Uncharacterized protein n=1 Tax=Sporomusa ovata TaxID=2378 RepID=A0A0U1KXE1_9FIRM|nr:hypothetical protein [Sporomusa ovata]EQB28066.1 hypothetical protein SOV_2c09890 [Sporomusa ovata DSM 2662]CQR71603.1 hypothetical protein SpAn4DRAFT_3469 [Sporomusa ovata]
MYPELIKSTQAFIMYIKEKRCWPSHEEWNAYAYKYGYYDAEKLSRLGIWGDLRELSALEIINSTKRFRKTKLLGYRYSIRDKN